MDITLGKDHPHMPGVVWLIKSYISTSSSFIRAYPFKKILYLL